MLSAKIKCTCQKSPQNLEGETNTTTARPQQRDTARGLNSEILQHR